ncbi:MAG: hypothetical protein WCG77_10550, partial [Actinomycetes bacterium]
MEMAPLALGRDPRHARSSLGEGDSSVHCRFAKERKGLLLRVSLRLQSPLSPIHDLTVAGTLLQEPDGPLQPDHLLPTSYGHLDAALKVAAAHPDVVVVQQGNFIKGTIPANAGTFFGTVYEPVYLAGGKGVLTINVNYSASTQYTSPFAVLSQSQDGAPEGDLVGVTIGNDGLVSASFSNGTQKSLAKILLANFSRPVGLRQMG